MARIRCHYMDCVFLDEGYCSAAQVEVDPDSGCLTYKASAEAEIDNDWDEEEEELDEWEEGEVEDEEDDVEDWLDDEEEAT